MKSLLDVPATAELLESLAVPLIGWRTDTLPLFYAADGGPPVSARVESAGEAAASRRALGAGGGGLLLGRPPDDPLDDVEPLIEGRSPRRKRQGVRGQAVTPFVLACLHRESGGSTLDANRDLIVANARLAGEIAAARRGAPRALRQAATPSTVQRPFRSTTSPSSRISPPLWRSLTMSQWTALVVRPSGDRVGAAEREVDRAVHLLVEAHVPGVARDPRVAPDSELAQDARAVVRVKRRQEESLVRGRARVDDATALELNHVPPRPRCRTTSPGTPRT